MVESLRVEKYKDLFDDEKVEDRISQIMEEQETLINDIFSLKEEIIDEELKKTSYKTSLWLDTNFKEKGLTNKELREAFVDQKMKDYISTLDHKKNRLSKLNKQYNLNTTCLSTLALYLSK